MCGGEGGGIVLDSCGGEDLASAGRVQHVHFVGGAGQSADFASPPEAPERSERGCPPADGPFVLVLGGFGMDKIHCDGLNAKFLDIGEAGDGAGGVIVVRGAGIARTRSVAKFLESHKNLGGLRGGHIEKAAPYFSGWETASREARDDAEVVGAAFQGAPEVTVG